MKDKTLVRNIFVCLTVGFITACSGISGKTQLNSTVSSISPASSNETPQQSVAPKKEEPPKSPIRKVDFDNFTFPRLPTGKCSMGKIRLTNGRYDAPENLVPRKIPSTDCWSVVLGPVAYADVTGDGEEEAFVILFAERGGTESSQDVFIYTLSNDHPVLLWKLMTGDRADGGLRRIYSENAELVVELYGVGTVIGKELYGTNPAGVGACCPKHYTRTKYKWDGNHFQQDGKEEVLPNPSGSSALLSSNN